MRKWTIIFILIAVFGLVIPVAGQTNPTVASLEVDLWPEYDRSDMLVIYKLTLSSQTSLPIDVRLRIPSYAGEPNAVAMRQADGGLVNLIYQRELDGDWAWIEFTAASPEIQLEYYDPYLEKEGANRQFVYTWVGDLEVESFLVKVQQPLGAASLHVIPDLGQMTSSSDGFKYYVLDVGSVDYGQNFTLELKYIKETDALSIEGLQVQPSAPISQDSQGKMFVTTFLPWILGFLGIILVGGGLLWYWKSEKEVMGARPRHRRKSEHGDDQTIRGSETVASAPVVYCHQCGKRAEPGDRFCRSCGAKLKG